MVCYDISGVVNSLMFYKVQFVCLSFGSINKSARSAISSDQTSKSRDKEMNLEFEEVT